MRSPNASASRPTPATAEAARCSSPIPITTRSNSSSGRSRMFAESGPRILVTAASEDKAREYCDALREAGADPTVASAGSNVSLEEFDGLLVTGGGDVDPAIYGGDVVTAE